MVIDLWFLVEHANPSFNHTETGAFDNLCAPGLVDAETGLSILHDNATRCWSAEQVHPELTSEWCAVLQPVIILCGTIPRFWLGELRVPSKFDFRQAKNCSAFFFSWFLGFSAWAAAFFLWQRCSVALSSRLNKDGAIQDLLGFDAESSVDEWRALDQRWITVMIWLQTGYPAVSALEFFWVQLAQFKCCGVGAKSYPAFLSVIKDLLYGTLDVLTKGGLAMYVANRAVYQGV